MEHTIWKSFDQDKVQVLGINHGETIPVAEEFAKNFQLSFPILHERLFEVYEKYKIWGISPFPLDCIIDQKGIVRYLKTEYDPQVMVETINNLLASNDVPKDDYSIIPNNIDIRAFPNPFNGKLNISITSAKNEKITLNVFNVNGIQIISDPIGYMTSGSKLTHSLNFENYASGIYMITAQSNSFSKTVKAIYLK